MWVVLKVQPFEVEQIEDSYRFPYPFTVDMKPMIGYLPVYATREDALKEFPDAPLAQIEEAKTLP